MCKRPNPQSKLFFDLFYGLKLSDFFFRSNVIAGSCEKSYIQKLSVLVLPN